MFDSAIYLLCIDKINTVVFDSEYNDFNRSEESENLQVSLVLS